MTKEDIFEHFFKVNSMLTGRNIVRIMIISLFVSAIIFITYRVTHNGTAYSAKINATNTAISMISTVIMLMISSNIVISMGMVGALSIVRFRTAVKDSWDVAYIFWSVVEGLAVGSQNFKLAIITTAFIAVIMIILSSHTMLFHKYLVVIRTNGDTQLSNIEQAIASHHKHYKLRASNNNKASGELIYEIIVRKALHSELIPELRSVENVTAVNFLEETGETVG